MFPACVPDGRAALIATKGKGDMDCVWCARNGSPGFSVLFEERHECDGVIIVDECPPFIIKVRATEGDTVHVMLARSFIA